MAKNIVLVGMPGTGKTTVGQEISKKLGMGYIDTDELVKESCKMALRDFVAQNGTEAFMTLQRKVICKIDCEDHVISTGGGVVQDAETMDHLGRIGDIFYLYTPFEVLEERLAPERKLARKQGESFRDVFDRRETLYRKYSNYIVECSGLNVSDVTKRICELMKERCMDDAR